MSGNHLPDIFYKTSVNSTTTMGTSQLPEIIVVHLLLLPFFDGIHYNEMCNYRDGKQVDFVNQYKNVHTTNNVVDYSTVDYY
jgi:hypothetical protein